ncbi:g5363 [Coccomyxa elongata]
MGLSGCLWQPPQNIPLQQALLPWMRPTPKATNPHRGFVERKRAKMAAYGKNCTDLLAQKAALEGDLVTLLNSHECLSRDLPWHMQHAAQMHHLRALTLS